MSFALLILGFLLLIAAVRNTQGDLFSLLAGDFTGPTNFVYWTVSILLIGMLGYIPKLKALSVAFLTLVILVLVLKRGDPKGIGGGFFEKFTQGLQSTQSATPATTAQTGPGQPQSSIFDSFLPSLDVPQIPGLIP